MTRGPHLTPEARARVAEELRADFGASNREIGRRAGCTHMTVAAIRRTLDDDVEPVVWEDQPLGPEEHQQARRDMLLPNVEALLALGHQSDPFYCGTPRDWELGKWFAGLWEDFGFGAGTHIRRVHYRADAAGAARPDGTRYLNNATDYGMLGEASEKARILGLVDPELFTDRRTDAVIQHVTAAETASLPMAEAASGTAWIPSLDIADLIPRAQAVKSEAEVTGYGYSHADQPVLIEVVVEKSTVNDVLLPLCSALGANLKVGKGIGSITNAIELLRRAEEFGHRTVHVVYIADLDRAGTSMPIALARQCQFWAQKLGIDVEVTVERIALTAEQVEEYGLPQHPETGATELDALEALVPGELGRLVREAVEGWRDPGLEEELEAAAAEAQRNADAQLEEAVEELDAEAVDLAGQADAVLDALKLQLRPLLFAAETELEPLRVRAGELEEAMEEAARDIDWDLPERPEAVEPDADRDGLLYDSRRTWLEQNAEYQRHKSGAA